MLKNKAGLLKKKLEKSILNLLKDIQRKHLHPENHFLRMEEMEMDRICFVVDNDFHKTLKKTVSTGKYNFFVTTDELVDEKLKIISLSSKDVLLSFVEIIYKIREKMMPSREKICPKILSKLKRLTEKLPDGYVLKCTYSKKHEAYKITIKSHPFCLTFLESNPRKMAAMMNEKVDDIIHIISNNHKKK